MQPRYVNSHDMHHAHSKAQVHSCNAYMMHLCSACKILAVLHWCIMTTNEREPLGHHDVLKGVTPSESAGSYILYAVLTH